MQPFIVLFLVFCCCCRLSAFFRRRRNSSSVSSGGCFNDMRAPLEAIIIILLRSFSLSSSSRASKRPRHKSHRPHADDMMMAVPLHAKKSNEKVRRMKKKKKNFCFCSASASGLKPRFPSMYVCTYYITYYYLPTQLALSILHVHRFYPFMYCRY